MSSFDRKSTFLMGLGLVLLLSQPTIADTSLRNCAKIEYGERCSAFGAMAYVKNSHNDKQVRVTVQIVTRAMFENPHDRRDVRTIEPGDRASLGCTSSDSTIHRSRSETTYQVVGCRTTND